MQVKSHIITLSKKYQSEILGLTFYSFSKNKFYEALINDIKECNNRIDIVTPNVDFIVNAIHDHKFKKILNNSSIRIPDGKPIIWASYFLNKRISEKISGSSLLFDLIKNESLNNQRIYLLGGSTRIILEKAIAFVKYSSNCKVSGFCPPFGFENDDLIKNKIIEDINHFNPDILIIGLGSPKQEKFLAYNNEKIKYRISLCLGASIDFLSGTKKMPPEIIKNLGFGWLWRLLSEPKRLWKRYLIKDMKFFLYIFQQKFKLRDFNEK